MDARIVPYLAIILFLIIFFGMIFWYQKIRNPQSREYKRARSISPLIIPFMRWAVPMICLYCLFMIFLAIKGILS